ncbi:DMT family transporter [Arthrobacter sp. USHLN218]|uniref:DMT family transporter n=1 Tax=Arthrobacter sp. USHLN218 TaxID=3081232 RepID=UPI003018D626
MTPARSTAIAAYVVLGLVWGFNFVFMHMASPFISAEQTTLLRIVFGLVPVVIFALAKRSFAWRHLRHIHHFLVMAVLASGLYYYAYAAGTYRLDSGIAGALSGSIPLFAFLAAVVALRTEPFTARKAAGLVIGALGVFLLARPWAAGAVDVTGVLFMLLGSASLGASFAYARRFISPLGIPAAASATYQMVLASLGLLTFTDLHGITAITQDPPTMVAVVLGLGAVGTGVAFILYYITIAGLGALTASTATYIPPVIAMVIGAIFLHEPVLPSAILAVVLILIAAVVTQTPAHLLAGVLARGRKTSGRH